MPRAASPKNPNRQKGGKKKPVESPHIGDPSGLAAVAAAAAEAAASGPAKAAPKLEVPTKPVEVHDDSAADEAVAAARKGADGKPPVTVNIAKLQAMNMTELNAMAKEMGIENFGTMRKHEV